MTTEEKIEQIKKKLNFTSTVDKYMTFDDAINELYDAINSGNNYCEFSKLLNDPDLKKLRDMFGLSFEWVFAGHNIISVKCKF